MESLQLPSLATSQKEFRRSADALPLIIWTATPDGSVDYYNQRWFDYTGLTLNETKGYRWRAVIHPDDLDQCLERWSQAVRTGADYEVRYRLKGVAAEGYRWHLGRASAVRDDEGRISKWYGACTDIDDQKRAEESLLFARADLESRVAERTRELVAANAELTLEIVGGKRIEAEQRVLFEIMQGVSATANLDELLQLIHRSLSKILKAQNCFVALYERATGLFKMQFFVDQYDEVPPPQALEKSRTAYVFHTGRPILLTKENFDRLVASNEIESIGTPPASWLGVPLATPAGVLGVLVVQHYEDSAAYSARDLEFLNSVGGQIALAIERKRAEQALRESETQFKELFDTAPVAYHELDREGRIVRVNLAEQQLLGYTAEELQGRHAWEFIVEQASQHAIKAKLAGTAPLVAVERTFIRKDGTLVTVLVQDHLTRDKAGCVTGIRSTLHDITGLKQADAALRQSEERYRDLFENAQDAIYVHSLEGVYISVNRAAEELTGYSRDEIIGRNFADFMTEEYASLIRSNLRKKLEGQGQTSYEIEVIARDGRRVPVEVSTRLIYENGKAVGVQGMGRDIAERKRIDNELKKNELRLVEAQHLAKLGSWELEIATDTTSWSEALYHIYGIERQSYSATLEGYLNVVHPDDRERVSELAARVLQTAEGCSYQHRIIWPDESVRFLDVNLKVLLDGKGQPVKVYGTAQDVTDRVKLDEELKEARDAALESARLKSEFLANMSHEIRTPMNGVVGMAGLLLDTELDADQREMAETIHSSGDALLMIINDILDFSKIEAGKLQFELVEFDLRNALEETMELLAEKAREKQLEFASLIEPEVPIALRGDPGRLRQVMTNLIANALKFTEHGEVIVRVALESESESTATIRFAVSDTGIGISEAAQRKLFQPFTQADGSTTRKYGGTGLGLSISRQLVECMGGTIGITSEPGQGSTFWFTVVLEKRFAERPSESLRLASLEKLRVLIVDDHPANRTILAHQLGSWGMDHDEADSGVQALELLRNAASAGVPFDLAVLDLLMPGMNGFDLARAIKNAPELAAVKLVLLTSTGVRGDGAIARNAGFAAYLTKPLRQSQLFECLVTVVSNAASPDPDATASLVTRHSLREGKRDSDKLILLAEDNIVNQKVAVRQLQRLGYRADTVANGHEALEALSRIPYDLVLMDCQMPEMDGYEATLEIRRREGARKHTPIVAMTAHALPVDRERSLAAGMDDHITKPVKPQELRRVLERCFSLSIQNVPVEVTSAADVPPVDLDQLRQILGDDPAELFDLLNLFRTDMAESLVKLATAIACGDASLVEQIAHSCAGMSANCGVIAVIDDLRELERLGRENQLGRAAALNERIGREFERFKRFLEETPESLAAC